MLDVYYALFVDSDNKLLLLLPYLSTGILNLLQPAQAEVVMGQLDSPTEPRTTEPRKTEPRKTQLRMD
jgi:hypothetical protein